MSQENRTLRTRGEEFVANASKLNRQLGDLQSRRDDLARRVEELEATLAQETAAHAKLKAAHLDATEAHRLTASNLREELSSMTARSDAAERLLAEAREKLRERDAEIRGFEQRALESSLAAKSKDGSWSLQNEKLQDSRTPAIPLACRSRHCARCARSAVERTCQGVGIGIAARRRRQRLSAKRNSHWRAGSRQRKRNGRSSRRDWRSSRNSLRPNRARAPSPKARCRPRDRSAALGATRWKARRAPRRKNRHLKPARARSPACAGNRTPALERAAFWLKWSRLGFRDQSRSDSTCWLGGGQQGMPKPYSQDLRDRVIDAVESGRDEPPRSGARRYAISESVAIKWLERVERDGFSRESLSGTAATGRPG